MIPEKVRVAPRVGLPMPVLPGGGQTAGPYDRPPGHPRGGGQGRAKEDEGGPGAGRQQLLVGPSRARRGDIQRRAGPPSPPHGEACLRQDNDGNEAASHARDSERGAERHRESLASRGVRCFPGLGHGVSSIPAIRIETISS